jgi:hypothetical protein
MCTSTFIYFMCSFTQLFIYLNTIAKFLRHVLIRCETGPVTTKSRTLNESVTATVITIVCGPKRQAEDMSWPVAVKIKVKLSEGQTIEAHTAVRRWDSHVL